MTEERIIRIPESWDDEFIYGIHEVLRHHMDVDDIPPIELAPQRDWKPCCFGTRPACFGGRIDEPECKVCPYREVEK